jgi:hypothetical protein
MLRGVHLRFLRDKPCSRAAVSSARPATINRILHAHGLIKQRRKRWQRRRLATLIRTIMRAFEKLQADTKDLDDIPALPPAIHAEQLLGIECTAKDVTTGIVFVCLAYERSEINSLRLPPALPAPPPPRRGGNTVHPADGQWRRVHRPRRGQAHLRLHAARRAALRRPPPHHPGPRPALQREGGKLPRPRRGRILHARTAATEAEMLERVFGYIL